MTERLDKSYLVQEYLKAKGLVKNQLESFNLFVRGIRDFVLAEPEIKFTKDPIAFLRYKDVYVANPQDSNALDPKICRMSDLTYAAPVVANIEYTDTKSRSKIPIEHKDVTIGRIPIMVRSCLCVLNGKDDEELTRLGECPLDPGGYFIIKGTEKVMLIQEQRAWNRIVINADKNGCLQASVTSWTKENTSKTVIKMAEEKIYLELDQFKRKAMGMESDQEVVQMIGGDPKYSDLLLPSILECAGLKVHTRGQALEFLEKPVMLKASSYSTDPVVKGECALRVLRDIFLAHVPVHHNNFHRKCVHVMLMVRRMMDAIFNKDGMDNEDFLGNKQYMLSGQLLSLVFEDSFRRMNCDLRRKIDKHIAEKSSDVNIQLFIDKSAITMALERTLSTGNLDISRLRVHMKGTTQVVSRLSFIGLLGQMTRISPQGQECMKATDASRRALQSSQWGMICPCDTTVGVACGLVKNLALMTHVTADQDDSTFPLLCYTFGVETLELLPQDLFTRDSYIVMLNGVIIGKHRQPKKFADDMRKLRRSGRMNMFTSIYVNEKQGSVCIDTSGGRLCRPLERVLNGVPKVKEHHVRELKDGVRDFYDFIKDGLVEYVDANEENNLLIALLEKDITQATTHVEIDPSTILGVCAGLIPYPHHNDSKCNTYQCAIGKHAMGSIAYNQFNRMDALTNILVYPQRPLLTTKSIELVGFDKLGAGQNAIVAVMSYSGYDIGNAIVMNEASLDRGLGRCVVYKRECGSSSSKEVGPQEPQRWEIEKEAVVFSYKSQKFCAKKLKRQTRRPEVGDRFSCRHGKKSIVGLIVKQEDLPFTEFGICPDLIINPHGLIGPTTVGKMIELLGSKAGVSVGKLLYGTAFGDTSGHADTVDDISKILAMHGFNYHGKDFLYSGITGEPLQAFIFMGPIYYQKLKHMVIDKMKVCGKSYRCLFTRQPINGSRVGEMERDCLISYGASMLINEHFMISSDAFEVQVCRKCGLLGYYDYKLKAGVCSMCNDVNNMSRVKMPFAFKLLIQELQSMNIVPRLKLED